jgi:zinc protease
MMRYFATIVFALCAAPLWAMPDIQTLKTPNGVDAWLVEDHNIPFVALELRFIGGASIEPMEKRGVATLMTGLLEEGSGDMDAQAFATAREGLAASFGYDVYDDALSISAKMLTENRDAAAALLKQSLLSPRFDPDAVERVRAQILSILASNEKNPRDIASSHFYELAYPDHPYGKSYEGSPETVSALTREDLIEIHRQILVKDRVIVSAVGDITSDELVQLIDMLLDGLPQTSDHALPPPIQDALSGGVDVVDFPTPQSFVLFGHDGIAQSDQDFFAAYILNHILGGGGFESRLMTEVREKRGLTYGIGTFLVSRDYSELLMGQVSSANDTVAQAIEVIRDEWRKMANAGVTADELTAAKTYLTGAYPLRFDGNGPIANILVGMQRMGLSPDYIKTRNERINAITLEDINRVAKRILKPDDLYFLVVGQPTGLN